MVHSYCPTWQIKKNCFDYALLDFYKTRGYRIVLGEETGDYISVNGGGGAQL